ncbi:hypothetical protein M422DRAFT_57880 [Sphaerobolus stellatus SS14]|nr:hypothetical protein M422DRAFT_57880 [Sphaerobolus stellatus SS14]
MALSSDHAAPTGTAHKLTGTIPGCIPYGARFSGNMHIPKYSIPEKGAGAEQVYQIIHDELSLDGTPVLNLASFVQTWMPKEADRLMDENKSKNLIDQDEYPMTQVIHTRCLSMLADLWHALAKQNAVGTATTGSSEAIQLGGLAMKRSWQARMKSAGKNIHEPGPNIVMGANAQVALEKFARYFEVEARLVPVSERSHFVLDPKLAMQYVDENTIGVYVILGSTYTGHYESATEMSDLLDDYEKKTGNYVPIHVDAASGGFLAPFLQPDLLWDFRIPRVVSINSSGHKFGLTYVGVGWVVWRDQSHLPQQLIFELHYLGSTEHSFSLNFSRPAAPIIAQYFNFLNLGRKGYRAAGLIDMQNARLLSRALEKSGYFHVISDIHRPRRTLMGCARNQIFDEPDIEYYEPGLPVVAFRFSDEFYSKFPDIQQKWVQILLRSRGWIVPNYELPPNLQNTPILRVVVKENLTEALIDSLVCDLVEIVENLASEEGPQHALDTAGVRSHVKRSERSPYFGDSATYHSGTYSKPC